MWANAIVRISGQPLLRPNQKSLVVASLSGLGGDAGSRNLSTGRGNDNNNNNNRSQGSGDRKEWRNNNGRHGRRPKKTNYSDTFLKPAARGELKNHQSNVPKLTGRRPKGHGVRGADDLPGIDEEMELLEMEQMNMDPVDPVSFPGNKQNDGPTQKTGTIKDNSPFDQLNDAEANLVKDFLRDYQTLINSEREEKFYWSESDYDLLLQQERAALFAKLRSEATQDDDGNLVVEVDDETFAMFEGMKQEEEDTTKEPETKPQQQQRGPNSSFEDPVFQFVAESMGMKHLDNPPPADYDRVLPLQIQGPTMYDFVESMMKHPTKYGEVRWEAPNEESNREPLADLPPNRQNPSVEFVNANMRFLYVWGLPPLCANGEPRDMENPLHCLDMQTTVGSLFAVPPEQVSVASTTSAFVGFPLVEDYKFAVEVGPMLRFVEGPVSISKYNPDQNFALAKDHADALILLENLPLGLSPALLASSLFPSETEAGQVYGNLSADKIVMLSPNSAVIAMETAEKADQAVASELVHERLVEIGQHRIRYSSARRELVFTGTHGGPDRTERLRRPGPRLIVDGDMPTKSFFISHASSLYLRNLDPSVTKEDIAAFFQPFCSVPRDVQGSTEFVTCEDGLPTGRAFVGFDEIGEAAAALESLTTSGGGRIVGLGSNVVIAKQVKELNKTSHSEKRSVRSEDDLLDSLNNWKQHVDPEDMEELQAHGISMEALDEAFRAIRYHNTTFASMDQAMRKEALNPDKDAGGMYKEFVQTYIQTLKECLSTPENPGPIYESIMGPGEEVDTEFFDIEEERLEELRKRRGLP